MKAQSPNTPSDVEGVVWHQAASRGLGMRYLGCCLIGQVVGLGTASGQVSFNPRCLLYHEDSC